MGKTGSGESWFVGKDGLKGRAKLGEKVRHVGRVWQGMETGLRKEVGFVGIWQGVGAGLEEEAGFLGRDGQRMEASLEEAGLAVRAGQGMEACLVKQVRFVEDDWQGLDKGLKEAVLKGRIWLGWAVRSSGRVGQSLKTGLGDGI